MADINSIVDDISSGVAGDPALSSWVAVYYDTTLAVFENCDPRKDPGPDDCPLVVVTHDTKSAGLSNTAKACAIQISCLVYDTDTETTLHGVVRFLAGRRVEEMRKLVLAAAIDGLPDDIHLADVDTMFMPLDEYPLAAAVMVLTLTQEKLIGSNPFE